MRRGTMIMNFRNLTAISLLACIIEGTGYNTYGQDWSSYEARRNWLLNLPWPAPSSHRKLGMAYNLANFYKYPRGSSQSNDAVIKTVGILHGITADMVDPLFFPLGVVRAIYQFGDRFTPTQLNDIAADAQTMDNWYGGGTENHNLMRLSNGYLLAQKFPSSMWYPANTSSAKVNSAKLMADVKEKLRVEGQMRYDHSFGEASSPNYILCHLIPLQHLYEFAEDKEVKNIAEAMILQLLSHLSVNVYRGYILDPYPRFYNSLYTNGGTGPERDDGIKNSTILLNWLYWNQCKPTDSRMYQFGDNTYLIYAALSSYRPPIALEHIANLSSDNPDKAHWVKTSEPGHNGSSTSVIFNVERRSVWRDREFAIGSMTGYHYPAGWYCQDGSKFGIAYRSDDRLQYLQAGHPYWLADASETPSNFAWWQATLSPFMQVAQHKNTAIVMFNITDTDPWPNSAPTRPDFFYTSGNTIRRSNHMNNLRKECGIRYSVTMDQVDEVVNSDGTKWLFLNEGDTYIGIRSLTTANVQPDDANVWKAFYATAVLHGGRSQTGFVVEIGTSTTSGGKFASFDAFKANLSARNPTVAWGSGSSPSLLVEYTNSDNISLKTEYDTNLIPDTEGKVRMIPNVWVNSVANISDTWPAIDARLDETHPLVTMVNKVLKITNPVTGEESKIDWSGNLPIISQPVSSDVSHKTIGSRAIKIYPDPASDMAYINTDGLLEGRWNIQLISMDGVIRSVEKQLFGTVIIPFDVSKYSNGFYMLILKNGKDKYFNKFIICK